MFLEKVFENESYKLGIPLRTRHNEVAPAQFECAPIFEEVNIAVDHNILLMDVMTRVAKRHRLVVLLHEKPFAGINGSGKHNNWSLSSDKGVNLLSPGKTPMKNLQFLTFFVNTIKAVYEKYPNLHIIHLDAHTDLRESFFGRDLSHATFMRHVHKFVGNGKIYQFGIRSGEKPEFDWVGLILASLNPSCLSVDARQ